MNHVHLLQCNNGHNIKLSSVNLCIVIFFSTVSVYMTMCLRTFVFVCESSTKDSDLAYLSLSLANSLSCCG